MNSGELAPLDVLAQAKKVGPRDMLSHQRRLAKMHLPYHTQYVSVTDTALARKSMGICEGTEDMRTYTLRAVLSVSGGLRRLMVEELGENFRASRPPATG